VIRIVDRRDQNIGRLLTKLEEIDA